jgi:hypothetical protein
MNSVVQVKDGVSFAKIAPGGFRILSAIDQTCARMGVDLVITSACDGAHSGPNDPHHRGEAYDIRSHDFTPEQKNNLLDTMKNLLGTEHFYGFLEAPGTDNEHFHFQVRKGTTYP